MHVRINAREQACADIKMTLLMDAHDPAKKRYSEDLRADKLGELEA